MNHDLVANPGSQHRTRAGYLRVRWPFGPGTGLDTFVISKLHLPALVGAAARDNRHFFRPLRDPKTGFQFAALTDEFGYLDEWIAPLGTIRRRCWLCGH